MTEATVSNELVHVMDEGDSSRNITDKVSRFSHLLNSAITRRVITIKDKRGTASARIGSSISKGDGKEDFRVSRRLRYRRWDRGYQHCHRSGGYRENQLDAPHDATSLLSLSAP